MIARHDDDTPIELALECARPHQWECYKIAPYCGAPSTSFQALCDDDNRNGNVSSEKWQLAVVASKQERLESCWAWKWKWKWKLHNKLAELRPSTVVAICTLTCSAFLLLLLLLGPYLCCNFLRILSFLVISVSILLGALIKSIQSSSACHGEA